MEVNLSDPPITWRIAETPNGEGYLYVHVLDLLNRNRTLRDLISIVKGDEPDQAIEADATSGDVSCTATTKI